MQIRYLGNSGLKVSAMALGTMTFGREATEADSHKMLDVYQDRGGNFLDSANVYSDGESERIVGNWLKSKDRDDLVVATKVRFSANLAPNRVGLSRKHIMSAVEQSLKNLRTDYIDLYQTHCWDEGTPLEESLSTLDLLVRQGKVRYLGASNISGWQLQRALDLADMRGWHKYVSLQPLYNLLDRELEWELVPLCRANGLGIIPWSPLRGGWLSGKFKRGMQAPAEGSRIEKAEAEGWSETWSAYNTEATWAVVDAVHEIAAETGASPAQVALSWVMNRPGVTAPIVGARTLDQLKDNLGAAELKLSQEQRDRLTEVSEKRLPYPYDFIAGASKRR